MKFLDIIFRKKSDKFTEAWANDLRQAGINLENAVIKPDPGIGRVHGDFSVAALTFEETLLTLSAKQRIPEVMMYLKESFAGVTSLIAEIGTDADHDRFFGPFDLMQATTFEPVTLDSKIGLPSMTGTTPVKLFITATGSNLDQLSAGEFELWISKSTLPAVS